MLKRLYVHNFRCLENFELPINGNRNILLIGKNGSGKSTLGVALEVLQRIARGVNKVDGLVKPKDFSNGHTEVPMRFEIDAEIGGSVYHYELAFEYQDLFKSLRVRDESLFVNELLIYSRNITEVAIPERDSAQVAMFQLDWHLVALPIVQERSTQDPLSIFKRWLAGMLILRPTPSLIKGESSNETLAVLPSVSNFGEWFAGLIAQSPAAYVRIDKYLRQIMPDLKQITNPIVGKDTRSLSIEFSDGSNDVSIPFEDLSDGEKCFLISSLAIAANTISNPLLCYWDEPDAYLAPEEVGHLVTALRKAYGSHGQFITTSHNPEALRRFADENTVLLYRRSHMEPTATRILGDLQIEGDLVNAFIRGDIEP